MDSGFKWLYAKYIWGMYSPKEKLVIIAREDGWFIKLAGFIGKYAWRKSKELDYSFSKYQIKGEGK